MKCSNCGKNGILVLSSIINGALCKDCADKLYNAYKKVGITGDKRRKAESEFFNALAKIGKQEIMIKNLMNVHKKYTGCTFPSYDINKSFVSISYIGKFRGCNAIFNLCAQSAQDDLYVTITYETKSNFRIEVMRCYDKNCNITVNTERTTWLGKKHK